MKNRAQEEITRALDEFNKYHGSEARGSPVSVGEASIIVRFEGSFCGTCGFYDYLDDFRVLLEDLGFSAEKENVRETGKGAVVSFKI